MGSDDQNPGGNLKTPPAPIAPGMPAETPLPDIAAKADDLFEIKKAVEDAASVSGGLWLSYLFVVSYVAFTAGAVTHEDLLLEHPVKLPLYNVERPLLQSFLIAPFVVLTIHAYALIHFFMLGNKTTRFHNQLRRQFPDQVRKIQKTVGVPDGDNKEIRDNLRRLLPSNIFVQILAGPPELRTGSFGLMLNYISLVTLVLFPVLVLLQLQIQFLPFHDPRVTWAQRSVLFLDLVLMWRLRPTIPANFRVESSRRVRVLARVLRGFGFVLPGIMSIAAIWFSIVVATIPGEWQETTLAVLDKPRWHDLLFEGEVDKSTRRRKSLFSNTLVLPGFKIHEAQEIDESKKTKVKGNPPLRGRHLEGAALIGADFTKTDLSAVNLKGASLDDAQLQGASLVSAQLRGTSLIFAQLQGAGLDRAQLQGALLFDANLQGASLGQAQLQDAKLDRARLQGASLLHAQLQGAWLNEVKLQGASLQWAQLQGATLNEAKLEGASLQWAQLQGATLNEAKVNATDFSNALLWRTYWGDLAKFGAVRLEDVTWNPVLPAAQPNDPPLPWRATEILDCRKSGSTMAPCNPDAEPPPKVADWQKKLSAASFAEEAFAAALAKELRSLVCESDTDAIHILRGVSSNERLAATGREAPALVDFILSKDCPVSASLTEDDKARLLKIKQDAEKDFASPSASKQDQ
jgi:uncharacterized protein YjbI with pentapeptide repeats